MPSQISSQEVRLSDVVRSDPPRWWTAREAASVARVNPVTARRHLARLADLGVMEENRAAFGGHRFRLAPGTPAREYLGRLDEVRLVLSSPSREG